jgi:hypothetical protein
MAENPVSVVKSKFGDKAKLVAEVEKFTKDEALWMGRMNESKGLAHVSNAKLLRLHATFAAVKEKFGSRAKLIDAICEVEKRTKDEGFKKRLDGFPVPRLFDMYKSAQKRSGGGEAEKKAAAPKKAAAKKAAAAAKKAATPVKAAPKAVSKNKAASVKAAAKKKRK